MKNSLRVLHLRASNFYGGPERQLHFHALMARNTEYNITIGSFSENRTEPDFIKKISQDGINTHTFDVKNSYDLKSLKLIKTYLAENNIDILCTHDHRSSFLGWLATMNSPIRWVVFSRGWTSENLKIRLYCLLDKFIIRFAKHVVAVSHAQKKRLEKVLISSNKISVVHNAIDPIYFESIPPVNLKERFDLPANSIVGITGGRFSREKGQLNLIEAAKVAVAKNDKLYFILFGDGPDLNMVKNKIISEDLQNNVICPGFEKKLIGCLKGSDFLVNPSLSEGLPNIVLEAMAVKVPTIATTVGGLGELIENNRNGLLVKSESTHEMVDAILKLTSDPELAEKIKINAYETLLDKFSFNRQYEKLISIYDNLVK